MIVEGRGGEIVHLVAQFRQAVDGMDGALFIAGKLTVDAAERDDAPDAQGDGCIEQGGGVAFHVEVRLVAKKDEDAAPVVDGEVEFVALRLQRLRVAVFEPDYRSA